MRLIPNNNLGHLRQFLREELARIPQQSITTVVGSMRKRLAECIASRGGPTFLAFLPSAHPHQYNQCYDYKTAICYEERNRKAFAYLLKVNSIILIAQAGILKGDEPSAFDLIC